VIRAEGTFPEAPALDLAPGDLVFLLTDGVVEAVGPDDEPFGIDRAIDLVRANRHRPAREIIEALYQGVKRFAR
jgi:serine phosphatase RsbU (regulator of sigma subunit)